jgi:hypothetical protein
MINNEPVNIQALAQAYAPSLIHTLQTGNPLPINTPTEVTQTLLEKANQKFGKLSARLSQPEIALLYQLLHTQGLQILEMTTDSEKLVHQATDYHKITLKNPRLQQGDKYQRLPISIVDGVLMEAHQGVNHLYTGAIRTSLGLPEKISFIIMPNGEVRFGSGHYYLAGNTPIALIGAGVLRAREGKIISIMNDSNHFRPTRMEFISSLRFLAKLEVFAPHFKIDEVPITTHQ